MRTDAVRTQTRRAGAPSSGPRRGPGAGVFVGLVTAAVAIGVAHLVAGMVGPAASPLLAVGQAAVDIAPAWLREFAIRTFGQSNKTVLLWGIGVVLTVAAAALGIAALRRLAVGFAGLAGFGVLGVVASLTRPQSGVADALPTLAGTAAGGLFLLLATAAMRPAEAPGRSAERPRGYDRRRFLLTGLAGVGVATISGAAGSVLARRFRADASRAEVGVPTPASRARPATGAELAVRGAEPFFTPNDTFYRVDTALFVPAIAAEDWRLRIHGMVERELTLDYATLLARPLIERDITLACVSNEVGGPYVGNARWIGAPLRDLLTEAGLLEGADQVVTRSADGFTIGTPTAVVMDGRDAMLAVTMNGEPLPLAHGFPVRMIVPGLYGYVSAMKWLADVELTTFDAYDAYWIERGWAERAPIKTMSRIDTPRAFATVRAGSVAVAGVAWAQHVGIDRVEIRVDEGPWTDAELAAEDTVDTWRQWVLRWEATPGEHRIRVRATDRSGVTQTAAVAEPFPDGATGHHEITVSVA